VDYYSYIRKTCFFAKGMLLTCDESAGPVHKLLKVLGQNNKTRPLLTNKNEKISYVKCNQYRAYIDGLSTRKLTIKIIYS
jgi:hypothetical protein